MGIQRVIHLIGRMVCGFAVGIIDHLLPKS